MCLQDVNVEVWATLIKGIGTETLGPLGIHICYKIRHGFKGYHQDLGCKVIFSWWVLNKLLGKYYYFFIFFLVFSFPTGMFLSYLSYQSSWEIPNLFYKLTATGNFAKTAMYFTITHNKQEFKFNYKVDSEISYNINTIWWNYLILYLRTWMECYEPQKSNIVAGNCLSTSRHE